MTFKGAALAFAFAGGAALAQDHVDGAPESAPTPQVRPAPEVPRLIPPEEAGPSTPDDEADDVPSLIPPERAGAEAPSEEAPGDDPEAGEPDAGAPPGASSGEPLPDRSPDQPPPPAEPPMPEILAESEAELAACLAALDDLGVVYERAEPILDPEAPECGIANPVAVSALAPGVVLEPAPTIRCDTALAGARWVADVVLPFSARLEGRGALVAIDQGTAYLCRPRADGAISEHAFGNALDVMGFRFASGDPIPVQPRAGDGTLEEAFQRAVRAGACLDFTTVLGPGSDEDHADHLHLDVRARERGFRICE